MSKSAVFTAALLLMGSQANAMIQGLYGSECLQVEGLSAYKDMAFDGETLKQVQTVFGDQECGTPAYDFIFEGPYMLDERQGLLDYSFQSIKLTPLTRAVADNFNHYQLCGISDWQVGKPEFVAGLDCGGQQIPDLDHFVYDRIESNKSGLRMGRASDDLNGSAPDQRPAAYDDVYYHAK